MVGALAFRPHSSRNRIRRRLPFSSPLVSPFKWEGTCALRLSSSFRLALLCTVELSSTEPAQIYKIDRWWCASKSLSNILSIYLSIHPSYLPKFKDSGGEILVHWSCSLYIHLTRPTWLPLLLILCFSLPPPPPLAVAMMKGFNLGNSHNSGFLMTKASFDENALVYCTVFGTITDRLPSPILPQEISRLDTHPSSIPLQRSQSQRTVAIGKQQTSHNNQLILISTRPPPPLLKFLKVLMDDWPTAAALKLLPHTYFDTSLHFTIIWFNETRDYQLNKRDVSWVDLLDVSICWAYSQSNDFGLNANLI